MPPGPDRLSEDNHGPDAALEEEEEEEEEELVGIEAVKDEAGKERDTNRYNGGGKDGKDVVPLKRPQVPRLAVVLYAIEAGN